MADTRAVPGIVWEERPDGLGQASPQLYPEQDAAGIWGWTPRAADAEGFINDNVDGVLGVDTAATTGGFRVFRMGGILRVYEEV